MHFCLPAQLMRLVEMSPGLRTDARTFETAWEFCKAMGQNPVKTKDNPGFILNYFLIPFNNDVIRMVESGIAEPADIDRAAEHFRRLIDHALRYGGSYFLTYHRFAERSQVLRAHPGIQGFLAAKRVMDPGEIFQSDWYLHMKELVA
jgi:hypothetical protein